jgi:hypothetical protein
MPAQACSYTELPGIQPRKAIQRVLRTAAEASCPGRRSGNPGHQQQPRDPGLLSVAGLPTTCPQRAENGHLAGAQVAVRHRLLVGSCHQKNSRSQKERFPAQINRRWRGLHAHIIYQSARLRRNVLTIGANKRGRNSLEFRYHLAVTRSRDDAARHARMSAGAVPARSDPTAGRNDPMPYFN